jgi:uncharacterized protein YqeY
MEVGLRPRLNNDLKEALRAGDKVKLSVVRVILSEIKNAELSRQEKIMAPFVKAHQLPANADESVRKSTLDLVSKEVERISPQVTIQDPDIMVLISKQAKQREESIVAFRQGNRPDLAVTEEAELAVLKTYLPAAATKEDIVAVVKRVIADTGAQGQRDKGKVMPRVIAELKGRADGRQINEVVTELLP